MLLLALWAGGGAATVPSALADTVGPRAVSAATSQDGSRVTVTFDESIRSSPAPESGLRVEVDDEYAALRRGAYVVSGRTVTAELSTAVTAGQSVTVEVERGGTIHDLAGNRARPNSDSLVTAVNPVPVVTLVLTPESVLEDGGTSTVTAKLKKASSEDTTVIVTVTPQHPAVAGDIAASANRTLRIAAGATASTGAVTIAAVDNDTAAPAKAFTVSATVAGEDGFSQPPVSRTLAIDDDDSGGICARTRQVREAILARIEGVTRCADVTNAQLGRITGTLDLSDKQITSLRTSDFAGLSSVSLLDLSGNALRTLPSGLLRGMSDLSTVYLDDNALTSLPGDLLTPVPLLNELWVRNNALTELPQGFFAGKREFAEIHIYDNPGDPDLEALDPLDYNRGSPLGVHVFLQPLGQGQFKVSVPVGTPCEMVVTFDVANGTMADETVTIPAGRVASDVFTVTRADGATAAVTVDIADLRAPSPDPRYPNNALMVMPMFHNGYVMAKAGTLPATVIAASGKQVSIAPRDGVDSVTEGTAAAFTLTRQLPHDSALTVSVDVQQTGDAIKTADSYEAPTDVSFPAGEGTTTLTVETQADSSAEEAGTVTATVTAATDASYTVGVPSAATVSVTRAADPEAEPLAARMSGSVPESPEESGDGSGGCAVEVSVAFLDADGEAVAVNGLAASDFTAENGRVGTPVAASDGLGWTVPVRATTDKRGLLRVQLAATERWRAAELVFHYPRAGGGGAAGPRGGGRGGGALGAGGPAGLRP